MRQLLFPIVIGLGGIVLLLWLGMWQLDRLRWKEGVIADIDARLAAGAVPLPAAPEKESDNYLTIVMEGTATGEEVWFLDSGTPAGTGHHVISAFETVSGRRVMLDQGLYPLHDEDLADQLIAQVVVQGNLLWPDDGVGPPPRGKEWYARDVAEMAQALNTEPVLVVLSAASEYDPRLSPLPVETRNIKNDHLEYAITWFLLAVVWLMMTLFYMARSMRPLKNAKED